MGLKIKKKSLFMGSKIKKKEFVHGIKDFENRALKQSTLNLRGRVRCHP